jgi:hypothetical protein
VGGDRDQLSAVRLVAHRPSFANTRLVLRRTILLTAAVLLSACDRGSHLNKEQSATVVRSSALFKSRKYAGIPRVVSVTTGGTVVFDARAASASGEMFGLEQLAKVDPVVAALRARGRVDVEEFVSPVPTERAAPEPPPLNPTAPLPATTGTGTQTDTKTPPPAGSTPQGATATAPATTIQQAAPLPPPPPVSTIGNKGWIHTFRVTPTAKLDADALSIDDGDDDSTQAEPMIRSFGPAVLRTPGWKLAIGSREFIKVLDVFDSKDKNVDLAPGELAVDFEWRWRPSSVGDVFDTGSSEFQTLPDVVRQAVKAGGVTLDTAQPLWSRATLHRTPAGWVVKAVDWAYGSTHQRDS